MVDNVFLALPGFSGQRRGTFGRCGVRAGGSERSSQRYNVIPLAVRRCIVALGPRCGLPGLHLQFAISPFGWAADFALSGRRERLGHLVHAGLKPGAHRHIPAVHQLVDLCVCVWGGGVQGHGTHILPYCICEDHDTIIIPLVSHSHSHSHTHTHTHTHTIGRRRRRGGVINVFIIKNTFVVFFPACTRCSFQQNLIKHLDQPASQTARFDSRWSMMVLANVLEKNKFTYVTERAIDRDTDTDTDRQ